MTRRLACAVLIAGDSDSPAHGTRDMPVWGPTFRAFEPSDQMVAARITSVINYVESIQAR